MSVPRTKRARDLANTRWHGSDLRDEIAAALGNGSYQPLNPATFGKPAPAPVPFKGKRLKPSQRLYMTFEECGLEDGVYRWFVRQPNGFIADYADDFMSARARLVELSLPNILLAHIETPF